MLSILIPAYHFDVRSLVGGLSKQLEFFKIVGEILVVDDCSGNEWKAINQEVKNYKFVKYVELKNNLGRSKIRNYLAHKAKHQYLLFLDCDMKIVESDFLKRYCQNLSPDSLLIGGISYQKEKPKVEYVLHWKVGKEREVKSVSIRQDAPYQSFLSSNFLIPKSIFNKIKFDESITQYGHEDTLFGLKLKELNIPILHIQNPIEHAGLESNSTFLKKTEKAIENLSNLHKEKKIEPTKLIDTYLKISRLQADGIVFFMLKTFESKMLNNLKSSRPSLRYFDFHKLLLFIKSNH